jgi:4-hydroxy-tetrahydrodipicolinate reductase
MTEAIFERKEAEPPLSRKIKIMRVAIIGYGKMGRSIEQVLRERGHEVGIIIDVNNADELNAKKMQGMDVAMEFTAPESAFGNIKKCLEIGVPLVCGTTAWSARLPEVERMCHQKNGAIFYTSNFSVGVNVVFELNRRLAAIMNRFPEYDVTVEEVHHAQKKDAPSGTAIVIAEDVVAALDRKQKWVGQTSVTPEELEVLSVRRSVAPGTHTVIYESPVDVITLSHDIKSRHGLASGAVMAAEFLVANVAAGRRGMFTMKDLLGF